MLPDTDNIYRAARLIQFGLAARERPAQEPEYQELINSYLDHGDFRAIVKEVARGLGLLVLDAGEHGVVLAPTEDSAFALRAAEFRPTSSSVDDRLLDGLVQLAIAATIFPRARDLEEDAAFARPPVTVEEVDDNLRQICQRFEDESKNAPDPTIADDESGLCEAWRVYQRRLSVMETSDGRRAQRTTRRIIEYGLDRLRDFGCFTKESRDDKTHYQPSWRYQVLVKQLAAGASFDHVRTRLVASAIQTASQEGR